MDEELKALLEGATEDGFKDWERLLRALQHRGYPSGKDGLKAIRARQKNIQTELERTAKELLASEAQRLFKKYPALTSFSWRQYTPYWIDGDACNFSAELAYPNLNGNDYYSAGDDPSLKEARQDIIAMLRTFDDSYLMYRLFGDHKIVKVNREGIFVETYEHG